jgi:predicted CXXCH cytochrome family protein
MKPLIQMTLALLAIGLIISLALAPGVSQAVAQDAEPPAKTYAEPPTTAIQPKNCVTAECHASVKDYKVLHGPVNVDACDACHELADAQKHTFKFTQDQDKLCAFCHVMDTSGAKVVHQPMKSGECSGCHDPHGGFDTKFLRAKSMTRMCNSCHQDVIGGRKHVHGPVAAGACGACHEPHQADHEQLLIATGKDLCLGCHREMQQQLAEMPFKHEPAEKECQSCHDAHAADYAMIVRAAPLKVCTDACHDDVKQSVFQARHKHSAVTEESACVNCHTPHGGELARLMKARPLDMCLDCHDQPVKGNDGRMVSSIADMTGEAGFKHGPVADGTCGGCHDVHGSNISRLLVDPYPATFYAPFELSDYKLCFECHDQQLVLLRQTEGLTGFRDGQNNLHFVHVNKAKRGRTCRACHKTHVASHEMNVRESVPYGNWELPINFTRTQTGGACAPGCHQELAYDRENAVGMPQTPQTNDQEPSP